MIEREMELFKKYVANYDLNNEGILMKYNHTFRVVGYAKRITVNCDDQELVRLSLIGALLHDIARFKQWTEYGTYKDANSFNHGDMAYEILKKDDYINNYVQTDYEKEIILNAVKQHNKKSLILTGDYYTDYVAKVVRDADKLDIIKTQYNDQEESNYIFKTYNKIGKLDINKNIINSVLSKEICNNKDTITYFDEIVRELAFIYDINFIESLKIVDDEKFVDTKIEILTRHDIDHEYGDIIKQIEKVVKDFINSKIKKEVIA